MSQIITICDVDDGNDDKNGNNMRENTLIKKITKNGEKV